MKIFFPSVPSLSLPYLVIAKSFACLRSPATSHEHLLPFALQRLSTAVVYVLNLITCGVIERTILKTHLFRLLSHPRSPKQEDCIASEHLARPLMESSDTPAKIATTDTINPTTISSDGNNDNEAVTSSKVGDENTNNTNDAATSTPNSEADVAPSTPTTTPKKKKVRRSRRNIHGGENPIIAPGFGTHQDLEQLSSDLGGILPVAAVHAMMNSRGRGIRRSKRGGDDDDDAAGGSAGASSALAGLASPGTSNAWAAFIKEEGVSVKLKKTDESQDDDAGGTRSARKRKQDNDAAAGSSSSKGAAKAASGADNDDDLEYDLSILQEEVQVKKKKTAGSTFGSLVQSGTLDATMIGRKTLPKSSAMAHEVQHLAVPTVLLPKIAITKVFSSCNSAHALAIDHASNLYGWGRNEQHQLGSGLPSKVVVTPQIIGHGCKTAAVGKSHSLMIDNDGQIMAIGSNKCGQCGWRAKQASSGNWKASTVVGSATPSSINFVKIACGEDFSVAIDDNGDLYTTGSSEFGQLGNGETGEYFVSANKLAFANGYGFERRSMFHIEDVNKNDPSYYSSTASQKMKTKPVTGKPMKFQAIACGKHHAIALEAPRTNSADDDGLVEPRVVTWGCGSYGCLGHGRQADEYFPRVLTSLPVGVYGANVAAGSQCTLLQTTNGHVYFWGKLRSGSAGGEATMRPSLVEELAHNSHVVTHCACGASSIACSTSLGDVIVWGTGPHGELGLGHTKKSSAKPTFVESLAPPKDPKPLLSLACGQGSLLAVVDEGGDSKLPQLDVAAVEEAMKSVVASGKTED